MVQLAGDKAIVVGAGIGGLVAAAALSPHFAEVLVLERDRLDASAVARSGVPHGTQAHALLLGAQQAFSALLPGFEQDLTAAGAVPLNLGADGLFDLPGIGDFPRRDFGFTFYAASRPLIEAALRGRVAALPNVTITPEIRVQALMTSADGSEVTGVRHALPDGGQVEQPADLVIDAAGRNGTLSRDMLAQTGRPSLAISTIGMEIAYTTGIFTIPDQAPEDWKYAYVLAAPPSETRSALILPIEGRRWLVTLVGRLGERPPADPAGFLDYARGLRNPAIYDALKDAVPEGRLSRFIVPGSTWRHFETLDAPPGRWLPLGDTICDFNPVYGQGMAIAAQQAVLLRDLLAASAGDLVALPTVFLKQLPVILAPAWAFSVRDLGFPGATGERPPDFAERMLFTAAVVRLALTDVDVHRLWTEVTHLVRSPSAFQEPELRARIGAAVAEMTAARA